MKDGFRDSPLPLNKWIAQQEKWTLDELEARSDAMAERFVELWPYPEVDFTPKVATGSQYSLDDDFDFTGARIVSYTFMGTKYYVSTWKDAVEGILRQICELYPADMHRIAAQKEFPAGYLHIRDGRVQGRVDQHRPGPLRLPRHVNRVGDARPGGGLREDRDRQRRPLF